MTFPYIKETWIGFMEYACSYFRADESRLADVSEYVIGSWLLPRNVHLGTALFLYYPHHYDPVRICMFIS